MRASLFCLLGGLFTVSVGCGADSMLALSSSGGGATGNGAVAVIDMDEVARSLGQFELIAKNVQKREEFYSQELTKLQQQFRDQVDQQAESQFVTDETADLDQLRQRLNGKFQGEVRKARGAVQTYQAQMVNEFRDRVRPIAKQVAAEQGLSIVFSKNELIFSFDEASDITQAVIARLQEAEPSAAAPSGAAPSEIQGAE